MILLYENIYFILKTFYSNIVFYTQIAIISFLYHENYFKLFTMTFVKLFEIRICNIAVVKPKVIAALLL